MSDYISRDQAIKALGRLCWTLDEDNRFDEGAGAEMAKEIIEHLPIAQRWISITERYPAEGEQVLLFDCEQGYDVGYFDHDDGYILAERINSACAWMPLPKPYSPGKTYAPTATTIERVDEAINNLVELRERIAKLIKETN